MPLTGSNASTVTIDAATVIDASATVSGNGGKVTVWSDIATAFYGTILARGGAQGGNGGFVETSGGTLAFTGTVNTSAPNGKTGTWLLDPVDSTIDSSAAAAISSSLANTGVMLVTTATGASGPGVQSTGTGNITIDAPISWSSGNTLTIDAYNAIVFNASINVMGGGGLVLTAFGTNSVPPAVPPISFGNGASVQFTGTEGSGQSLTINNEAYTLLYSKSEVQKINNNLTGDYALALPLNASGGANWTPIGTNSDGTILNSRSGFTGSFQGLGNAISNLTINLPFANNVGLFGVVGLGGVVENVNLLGANVSGAGNVGTLIGLNNGTVTNAYATGAVTGSGSSPFVGGLVGLNDTDGVINQSYASAAVNVSMSGVTTATTIDVGGLVGLNSGSITNSSAGGTVGVNFAGASTLDELGAINAGGLIGANGSSIANSYASGVVNVSISGTTNTIIDVDASLGGLVGNNGGSITGSYAIGAVKSIGTDMLADTIAGGLVGSNFGSITTSYAAGPVSIAITGAQPTDDTGPNAGGLATTTARSSIRTLPVRSALPLPAFTATSVDWSVTMIFTDPSPKRTRPAAWSVLRPGRS